jgi:hypothetical protein
MDYSKESYNTAISAQWIPVKNHMAELLLPNGLQQTVKWHSYFRPMDYSKASPGTAISVQWVSVKLHMAQVLLSIGLQ